MQEELHCKISQFIDDDLSVDEALMLLEEINDNPGLEAKLYRYQVVSQALKTDLRNPPDANFVRQISQKIEQENVHFFPHRLRLKKKYKTFLAVAASLAIVAVIVLGSLSQTQEENIQALQIAASDDAAMQNQDRNEQPLPVSAPQPPTPPYYDYLEAHQGVLYPPDSVLHNYARTASYGK